MKRRIVRRLGIIVVHVLFYLSRYLGLIHTEARRRIAGPKVVEGLGYKYFPILFINGREIQTAG